MATTFDTSVDRKLALSRRSRVSFRHHVLIISYR